METSLLITVTDVTDILCLFFGVSLEDIFCNFFSCFVSLTDKPAVWLTYFAPQILSRKKMCHCSELGGKKHRWEKHELKSESMR